MVLISYMVGTFKGALLRMLSNITRMLVGIKPRSLTLRISALLIEPASPFFKAKVDFSTICSFRKSHAMFINLFSFVVV